MTDNLVYDKIVAKSKMEIAEETFSRIPEEDRTEILYKNLFTSAIGIHHSQELKDRMWEVAQEFRSF